MSFVEKVKRICEKRELPSPQFKSIIFHGSYEVQSDFEEGYYLAISKTEKQALENVAEKIYDDLVKFKEGDHVFVDNEKSGVVIKNHGPQVYIRYNDSHIAGFATIEQVEIDELYVLSQKLGDFIKEVSFGMNYGKWYCVAKSNIVECMSECDSSDMTKRDAMIGAYKKALKIKEAREKYTPGTRVKTKDRVGTVINFNGVTLMCQTDQNTHYAVYFDDPDLSLYAKNPGLQTVEEKHIEEKYPVGARVKYGNRIGTVIHNNGDTVLYETEKGETYATANDSMHLSLCENQSISDVNVPEVQQKLEELCKKNGAELKYQTHTTPKLEFYVTVTISNDKGSKTFESGKWIGGNDQPRHDVTMMAYKYFTKFKFDDRVKMRTGFSIEHGTVNDPRLFTSVVKFENNTSNVDNDKLFHEKERLNMDNECFMLDYSGYDDENDYGELADGVDNGLHVKVYYLDGQCMDHMRSHDQYRRFTYIRCDNEDDLTIRMIKGAAVMNNEYKISIRTENPLLLEMAKKFDFYVC